MSLIFIALLPYENISTTKFSQITVRHLRLCELTSGYVTSFLVAWLPFPLRYRFVAAQMHPKPGYSGFPKPSWGTSSLMTSLRVMWGYFWPWCHSVQVTSLSCELLPWMWWNAPKKHVFILSKALWCHFPSDKVTSGWLKVTSSHLTSLLVMWPAFPMSYTW